MKPHSMIFSAPMVRAIQEGTKSQTRRLCKPQPPMNCSYVINGAMDHALCFQTGTSGAGTVWVPPTAKSVDHRLRCPHPIGSLLYVKEAHWAFGEWVQFGYTETARQKFMFLGYRDDTHVTFAESELMKKTEFGNPGWHKRNSLFLPKRFARIWLRVTDVRCEHVQEISEEDAMAEGIVEIERSIRIHGRMNGYGVAGTKPEDAAITARYAYADLWNFINTAPGTRWEDNPIIWAYTFERIEKPENI